MEIILSFFIILVFVIISLVIFCGVKQNKEPYKNINTKAKFYTYPPTKFEKIGSLYSPIIVRPADAMEEVYTGNCTNELYPKAASPFGKGEMVAPCDPTIEANYYAMRPILQPEVYNKMIAKLFKAITQKVPPSIPIDSLKFTDEFCNGECFTDVMKFIMGRINKAKNTLKVFKEYAKNDTWGGEQFAFLNQKVFSFSNHDNSSLTEQERAKLARYGKLPGPKKFVVTFTLHNTLRSSSIDVIAIVYSQNDKYYLDYIDFATRKPTNELRGTQINKKNGNIILENVTKGDNGPIWIYGNTIQNNLFNLKGFYDSEHPENNILVPGGVPEEFKQVLDKCDRSYLLEPANTQARFQGGPLIPNNLATQTNTDVFPRFPDTNERWKIKV
jgi:hypothetical protein